MVITKCSDSDYKFMIYTGKLKTSSNTVWLVVANQFATTDAFNSFGMLDTIKRDDEGNLSLYYHTEDGNTNMIDVSVDSIEALIAGDIAMVTIW